MTQQSLRRYTSLHDALQMLRTKTITLRDRSSWDDKNVFTSWLNIEGANAWGLYAQFVSLALMKLTITGGHLAPRYLLPLLRDRSGDGYGVNGSTVDGAVLQLPYSRHPV